MSKTISVTFLMNGFNSTTGRVSTTWSPDLLVFKFSCCKCMVWRCHSTLHPFDSIVYSEIRGDPMTTIAGIKDILQTSLSVFYYSFLLVNNRVILHAEFVLFFLSHEKWLTSCYSCHPSCRVCTIYIYLSQKKGLITSLLEKIQVRCLVFRQVLNSRR